MSTFRSFVIKENNGAIVKDVILENTENLPAGEEVLRCPQIGEQSGQGRPQGAADHPDGGRHHRHLCEQFPTDAP